MRRSSLEVHVLCRLPILQDLEATLLWADEPPRNGERAGVFHHLQYGQSVVMYLYIHLVPTLLELSL